MNAQWPPGSSPTLDQRIRETLGDRYAWAMHTEPVRRIAFMLAQAEDRAANAERALQVLQDTRRVRPARKSINIPGYLSAQQIEVTYNMDPTLTGAAGALYVENWSLARDMSDQSPYPPAPEEPN